MKRLTIPLILSVALAMASFARNASTDDEVAARNTALGVAGAFGNDGFKLRDGNWAGTIAPGKPQILQVNLYAGNQYWFTLGVTPAGKKLAVSLYDETGKPLETESYQDVSVAAAGFAPQASGPYYVKVEVVDGASTAFCLIYSYK
jgi:hypothetical protein